MSNPEPKMGEDAQWDAVVEATELLHEERYHDALLELRAVLEKDPRNAYAYYYLGVTLFECGELAPARDAYKACLKLAPNHLGARVALSHVQRSLGELRDAVREGLQALSQSPGDSDVLYALGLAYYARGDRSATVKYLTAFLEANPEMEVAIEVRGMLEAMGELADAPKPEPS